MIHIPFSHRFASLGNTFFTRAKPARVSSPELIMFNDDLAASLGINTQNASDEELSAIFSGNTIPAGASPLAMAYSGHQFGYFNPQLGDGRAILLGEVCPEGGTCFGIQLKGSGPTAFSRNGDGLAALGPVIREYLLSEAMHKLGIPTTRALAAVTTGEEVWRERVLPGGIITRVASSFVRVGTFQYFASRGDIKSIRKLADYVIEHNYPESKDSTNSYSAFLQAVVERQASLISKWMQAGFIHGVMNTDNMSVAGETIDYGPCAFMDTYDLNQVYSSIDRDGRYAYSNQPPIGLWNLTRLAESLVPLFAEESDEGVSIATDILNNYQPMYEQAWLNGMQMKLGLSSENADLEDANDKILIEKLLNIMAENNADFTLTFYRLSQLCAEPTEQDNELHQLFDNTAKLQTWLQQWRDRLAKETQTDAERQAAMQSVNPVYIPRNHQVEAAIRAAEDHADFSVFHELHQVLQNPFTFQQGKENYMQPPEADEVVHQTFCGT